jgi:DNA-binding NtrC family response regulator
LVKKGAFIERSFCFLSPLIFVFSADKLLRLRPPRPVIFLPRERAVVASLTQWSENSFVDGAIGAAAVTGESARCGEMVGRSLPMQRLFSRLRQAAPHIRIVAIEGEAGTGKTLTARTLHRLGPASGAAFVACAAARFMSAETQTLLEEARGGTLLLSRIGELSAAQQTRFVDFIEWWEHRSARDAQSFLPRQLFVSSSKPLRQLSAAGELRGDLSFRLTAIRFELPPLRERRDDIGLLADLFAAKHGAARCKPIRGLGPGALQRLLSHSWPGNVRELETVVANAAMDCPGQWIRPLDIPPLVNTPQLRMQAPAEPVPDDDPNLDRMILRHISQVLRKTGGNKLRAAQLLGISRSTLYRLLDSGNSASQEETPISNSSF